MWWGSLIAKDTGVLEKVYLLVFSDVSHICQLLVEEFALAVNCCGLSFWFGCVVRLLLVILFGSVLSSSSV